MVQKRSVRGMTRLRKLLGPETASAVDVAHQEKTEQLAALRRDVDAAESVDEAIVLFRDRVARTGFDPDVLLEYARFLIRHSRGSLAEEVLGLSLAQNGAQPDALESYLDLTRELDLRSSRRRWALTRLEADLPGALGAHRGALDFAIPYRLQDALETIGASSDPLNRLVIAIDRASEHDASVDDALVTHRGELGDNDVMRAQLTVALGRGNRELAVQLLQEADERAVPFNALRRAIRRGRAGGQSTLATDYLREYRKHRPGDTWAKALQNEYKHGLISNYELGKRGFPFPEQRPAPTYEPRRDHVLYLLHNSLPHHSAGYATRTHGLLSELNRIGWDVDGVTRLGYPYDMPGMEDLPDVPLHQQVGNVDYRRLLAGREIERKNPLFSYTERYSAALHELATTERPSIIHAASNHWNGLTAVKTARTLGIPSIYEVRGLWEITRGSRNPEWAQSNMFRYMARMEADAAKGATRVFTITEALREEMIDRGVAADKISIVPNGVDTSRFTPVARDESLAAQLGVTGKTVIGYVGSVLDYEGIELILQAAQQLARTREDFHVLIVGDGAELERFKLFVQEKSLSDVVTFTGRVPHEQVEQYYSLIDITPFPRLPLPVCEMVSPLKPFEAMAMGKAVVASDVAALAEIVNPGQNGLLHEKGSTESLIARLTELLDDQEHTRRLGTQAREWVVQNRDWSQVAQIIARTYDELTS
ncbi:glycosyltransferase family 4 protein [Brachybacterium sp. AOP42-E1-35]|uniref:glycosyltransferase family 4 protein n=1 Tax=Brachybacterium sp. AOP42-E1-35 TaxID=3457664 RepID=UPI00402A872A